MNNLNVKKTLSLLLSTCILSGALCACGNTSSKPSEDDSSQNSEQTGDNDDITYSTVKNKTDATITVSNTVINTVNPEIFGDNTSYRGEGYGLWDTETDQPEATLLEMLKNSGITHLRYPGGIEGDYYHWYEIIGDNRTAQIDPFSDEFPTYETIAGVPYDVIFGIEEFVKLCKQTNMKATLQVNAGTGTAQEAADLVAYCIENNINYTFFAIGNEGFSQANKVEGINIQKSPQEYVTFYKECYEKIRNVSENVRIGAIGIPRSNPLCRDASWESVILSELADKMDFYDVHIAYAPLVKTTDLDMLLGNYLSGSVWIQDQLNLVFREMKQYTGEYYDDIDIYITEWGPLGGTPYDNSLAGTILLSTTLNMMLNEPKIQAANHLPVLNHPYAGNLIGYENQSGKKTYWENASSYIFRWYSDMQNYSVLTTEVESSTFNTQAGIVQPAANNVNSIDAITCLNDENKTGTIIITNRNKEEDISVTLDLPFEAVEITSVKEVWHSNPLSYNSSDNPEVISETTLSTDSVYNGKSGLTIDTKSVSIVRIDFKYE